MKKQQKNLWIFYNLGILNWRFSKPFLYGGETFNIKEKVTPIIYNPIVGVNATAKVLQQWYKTCGHWSVLKGRTLRLTVTSQQFAGPTVTSVHPWVKWAMCLCSRMSFFFSILLQTHSPCLCQISCTKKKKLPFSFQKTLMYYIDSCMFHQGSFFLKKKKGFLFPLFWKGWSKKKKRLLHKTPLDWVCRMVGFLEQ